MIRDDVLIAGLALRLATSEGASPGILGGAAIYSAIGCCLNGITPRLNVKIGSDITRRERAFLRRLTAPNSSIETHGAPSPIWLGPKVIGVTPSGRIEGNPAVMSPSVATDGVRTLVGGNMDPARLLPALNDFQGGLVLLDCYASWIRWRPHDTLACIRAADVILLTERELALLPSGAQSELPQQPTQAILVKKGPAGVCLHVGGRMHVLPPPPVAHVQCDVGAGDLLLGALTAGIVQRVSPGERPSEDVIVAAYMASLPTLVRLLGAASPAHFIALAEALLS